MADPTPASPTPGDSAGAPTVVVTPQPTATAGGDDNAGLLAELEAELGKGAAPAAGGKTPAAAPVATPADEPDSDAEEPADEQPAAEDDDESAEDAVAEDEDEDLEDDEPAAEDDDDPAIAAEADKDPALKARLDAVRRTEERQRARLTSERQALERDRQQFMTEHGQALQRIQQFDQLVARAKYDLPAVVRALGIEPADYEYHAQSLMAHSPKFANDEKYRGAAEKAMREREAADRAAANERKLADLEAKIESKETQAAAERELDTYFTRAMRKATNATPITQTLIKSSPKAARAALLGTAHELSQKLGRMPKSAELLAAHEKKETHALALRGVKPTGKPPAAPAKSGAGAKPAPAGAKPNGKPAATPAKPAAATPAPAPAVPVPVDPLRVPTRDELLQELQSGTAN